MLLQPRHHCFFNIPLFLPLAMVSQLAPRPEDAGRRVSPHPGAHPAARRLSGLHQHGHGRVPRPRLPAPVGPAKASGSDGFYLGRTSNVFPVGNPTRSRAQRGPGGLRRHPQAWDALLFQGCLVLHPPSLPRSIPPSLPPSAFSASSCTLHPRLCPVLRRGCLPAEL